MKVGGAWRRRRKSDPGNRVRVGGGCQSGRWGEIDGAPGQFLDHAIGIIAWLVSDIVAVPEVMDERGGPGEVEEEEEA